MRLYTYASLGFGIGAAINYPLSGFVVHNFGWQSLFYIYGKAILLRTQSTNFITPYSLFLCMIGAVSMIWSFIWAVFVRNDPSTDRFISKEEKKYLSEVLKCAPKDEVSKAKSYF